ncbi:hypothetical protein KZ436_01715 [Glaesserella parasuis]|nr:hypothetical protein [Glaesserella parasuis]
MKLIKYFALIVLVYAVPTLFTETMAGDLSKIQQKSQALKTKIDGQKKNRKSLKSTLKNQKIERGKFLNLSLITT